MRVEFVVITFLLILGVGLISFKCEALKCPGKCTSNLTGCHAEGGKIVGYCTTELACCDLSAKKIGSCGDTKSGLTSATFQSPEYPEFSSGDSVCKFVFELRPDTQGLSVEFVDARMEGAGFMPHSTCESDMIYLKGFPTWQPPPRCGNLTGYAAIIDQKVVQNMKSLTVLALMSSKKYRWKIKISQLSHDKNDLKESIGEITSDSAEVGTNGNMEVHTTVDEAYYFSGIDDFGPRYRELGKLQPENTLTEQQQQPWIDESSYDENLEFEEALVVNGEDTLISEVPWQASLRLQYPLEFLKSRDLTEDVNKESSNCSSSDGRHFCGGSIVSNHHILSASHCFCGSSKLRDWQKIDNVKVLLGDTDLCSDDKIKYGHASQIYTIEKVFFHYAYDDSAIINDVLVIKLKEKIKFNEYIKPIALSKRNKTYVGKRVKVSGWGLTNLTGMAFNAPLIIPENHLKNNISVKIPHIPLPYMLQSTEDMFVENQTYCIEIMTHSVYNAPAKIVSKFPKYDGAFESTLCTTFLSNTTFKLVGPGDSGGPLVIMDKDKQPVQVGVVSFGVPALTPKSTHDNAFVDYFQDVSYYRDWIDLAMLV